MKVENNKITALFLTVILVFGTLVSGGYNILAIENGVPEYIYELKEDGSVISCINEQTQETLFSTFNTEEFPKLPAPKNLAWSTTQKGNIEFDAVAEANGKYRYTVYNNGMQVHTATLSGLTMYDRITVDFSAHIFVSGTYTFTVQACGVEGISSDSEVSALSPKYIYEKPSFILDVPTNLAWDSDESALATWNAVTNGQVFVTYYVELSGIRTNIVSDFSSNYYDFLSIMNQDGYYTFIVRALSSNIEIVANGAWSERSSVYQRGEGSKDITLAFEDLNFRAEVRRYIGKQDTAPIYDTDVAWIDVLTIYDKGITSLAGIEYFTALEKLYCHDNQLTELDVSSNIKLTDLNCSNTQLTELDVLSNTKLTRLWCSDNRLETLDVSENNALTELSCYDNQLSKLILANSDALAELWCSNNRLETLDVSNNTKLIVLSCGNNQLETLDVLNTELTTLSCYDNQLSKLILPSSAALTRLYCYNNELTALNASNNTALIQLWCNDNQLTELILPSSTTLTELYCYNNQLRTLDVSKNPALLYLYCYNNYMQSPDDVIGWRDIGALEINSPENVGGNFRFYSQRMPPVVDEEAEIEQRLKNKFGHSAGEVLNIVQIGSALDIATEDVTVKGALLNLTEEDIAGEYITLLELIKLTMDFGEDLLHFAEPKYNVTEQQFLETAGINADAFIIGTDFIIMELDLAVKGVSLGDNLAAPVTITMPRLFAAEMYILERSGLIWQNVDYTTTVDKITFTVESLDLLTFFTVRDKPVGGEEILEDLFSENDTGYQVDTNSGYIRNISTEKTVEEFLLELSTDAKLLDKNGEVITSEYTGYIGTGMKIRNEKNGIEITIIIRGDVTGNGNPGMDDAARFLEHLVGNEPLSGAYLQAAQDIVGTTETSAIRNLRAFLNGVMP